MSLTIYLILQNYSNIRKKRSTNGDRRLEGDFYYRTFQANSDNYFYSDLEDEGEEGEELDIEIIHADEDPIAESNYPADCCPENCYKKFPFLAGDDDAPFWQGWANLRFKTFRLIENKYFETAVITMILLSSLALVRLFVLSFYKSEIYLGSNLERVKPYRLWRMFIFNNDLSCRTYCITWTEYSL